jgi:hypothetical protein
MTPDQEEEHLLRILKAIKEHPEASKALENLPIGFIKAERQSFSSEGEE